MGLGRDIVYGVGLSLSAPIWGYGLLKTGKWRTDWPGRFGRTQAQSSVTPSAKRVLIHAVSVGEVNLIRGLVAQLTEQGLTVIIAVTTNTGIARARQLFGATHTIVRYPLDFTHAVGRFLDTIKPDLVAEVELEIWPNFVDACTKRNIPVCVINGRMSERSFKGYKRFRWALQSSFAQVAAAAVQTQAYAQRFTAMGVPAQRVAVLDTMKWDTAKVIDHVDGADDLATALGIDRAKPLIVAGSTGPGEDKLLIERLPDHVQLLIAPRKPEWFDTVLDVAPHAVRRTATRDLPADQDPNPQRSRIFLLDTIGELAMAYSLADVCIVGRSFLGLYGGDVMEPAALGKPVIIGPHHADFLETVRAMHEADGLIVTGDPANDHPMDHALALLNDPKRAAAIAQAGRSVIVSRQGSTARHTCMILDLLNDPTAPFASQPNTVTRASTTLTDTP